MKHTKNWDSSNLYILKLIQHNRMGRVPPYVLAAQKDKNDYCKSFEAILNRTCQALSYYAEKN